MMNLRFFLLLTYSITSQAIAAPLCDALFAEQLIQINQVAPKSNKSSNLRKLEDLQDGSAIPEAFYESMDAVELARLVVQWVRQQEIEYRKKSRKILSQIPVDLRQDADILLFFDSHIADKIVQNGFLNQHQTGSSSMTFAPDLRREREDLMLGLAMGNSAKAYPLRPKSAYLNIRTEKRLASQKLGVYGDYGDVAAVLKSELKDRSLWTSDDSLVLSSRTVLLRNQRPEFIGTFDSNAIFDAVRHYFYEALVFGPVGINDVDYFLVPNVKVGKRLRKTGKAVYLWKSIGNPVGREVYIKDVRLF